MKLHSVTVERFRSLQSVTLSNCGRFNVLIGKNNAGKSSILSALNAFARCLSSESLVQTIR